MPTLFLYEFICATIDVVMSAAADGNSSSQESSSAAALTLHREGFTMRSCLADDFTRLGWTIHTLDGDPRESSFRQLARTCDRTLIIAPEFAGLLRERVQWALDAGITPINASLDAITRTADKLTLSHELTAAKIPTPKTVPLEQAESLSFPQAWKPRDGAGSQATYFVERINDMPKIRQRLRDDAWTGPMIASEYALGMPTSVAFLTGPAGMMPLCPTRQLLSDDGRLLYQGGELPLRDDLAARVIAIAERGLRTIPGLRGYIGVDVVLGDASDGSDDCIIEINPRLSTSYAGLRQATRDNLAEWMLRIADGEVPPRGGIIWGDEVIRFGLMRG